MGLHELEEDKVYENETGIFKLIEGRLRILYNGWYWNSIELPYSIVANMKFVEREDIWYEIRKFIFGIWKTNR